MNLYYTNKGLDFDYYLPQSPSPAIIKTPEVLKGIDDSQIEERFVNLCNCIYRLTYEIEGLPKSSFVIQLNHKPIKNSQ